MSRLDQAIALLSTATRNELRDHAFGDCEIGWDVGETQVADAYFGLEAREVTVMFPDGAVRFTDEEADRLRSCGRRGVVERNDAGGDELAEQGPHGPPPEFFEEMAKDCRCCVQCATVPCDGVCAGGMCDEYCRCFDDRGERWDDDSFEDEAP